MFVVDQNDFQYRFGDSGPKYLMRGPRMNFGVVVLKPGQDFPCHIHNIMEENFFILEGKIEFNINGKIQVLEQGKFIHVEPKETHYLKNVGEGDCKAVFALAPYQEKDKIEIEM